MCQELYGYDTVVERQGYKIRLRAIGGGDMMEPKEKNFQLDDFQKNAIAAVSRDHSVLVSAPTGAGKTLIAEYLIQKCLKEDRAVIYTAPVKALSNQKFREFELLFPGKVGIITGDVNINPFAPLLIMTTEIFRNRILENPGSLNQHSWIIFDEIHYLDNIERGTVWEESLIFLPEHMKFVGLSATIPNVKQFSSWLKGIHPHPIHIIREDQRPVPLHFFFQCNGRICDDLKKLEKEGYGRRRRRGFAPNSPLSLIHHLVRADRLPCIYFSFSRKRCEYLARDAMEINFLTEEAREQILTIYDEYCTRYDLVGEERAESLRKLVARGIAYHHAGIHPMLKEILERLFTGKRIKIIFATETFALGINMPARTVVLDELKKSYGKFFRALKVRDFYQMAGRSGRRGIDKEGFVYSRVNPRTITYREIATIFKSAPEKIRSRFNVSYATILNLYETHGENLLDIHALSFHYFQERSQLRTRQLEQTKARLAILKQLGYIHAGQLTEKGHFAKKIHGYELPISELFGYGALEDLSVRQLGIFALAAVFEPRAGASKRKFKDDEIRELQRMTTAAIRGIQRFEKKMQLSYLSKKFFYDLSDSMTNWMKNEAFDKILQKLQIDEGEVIRYYRMSIQILREMLETPAADQLKKKIRQAIGLIDRDVIDAEAQLRKTVDPD
jgi:superfamily II RNA helicase